MKKYDVTLTAHYRKTVSVCAESPEQAKEKTKIILFDTDLINFTDADFVCGEADMPCLSSNTQAARKSPMPFTKPKSRGDPRGIMLPDRRWMKLSANHLR